MNLNLSINYNQRSLGPEIVGTDHYLLKRTYICKVQASFFLSISCFVKRKRARQVEKSLRIIGVRLRKRGESTSDIYKQELILAMNDGKQFKWKNRDLIAPESAS